MKEGVVTEIATLAKSASNQKDPHTKEVLGRTLLFEPEGDGKYKRTDMGGPGVQPNPVVLHTLTGLLAYLVPREPTEAESAVVRDGAAADAVLVHVVNEKYVRVLSALDDDSAAYRTEYATVAFEPLIGSNGVPFAFGKYLDLETFNIALQSLFEETTDRTRIALVTGTVREEKVTTSTDDGVTQKVVASAGVIGLYETDVPNPVRLVPFRTFREVPQPESLFILRLKKGDTGALPMAALFEADGGAWKLEAIQRIATYLRAALPADITVLA